VLRQPKRPAVIKLRAGEEEVGDKDSTPEKPSRSKGRRPLPFLYWGGRSIDCASGGVELGKTLERAKLVRGGGLSGNITVAVRQNVEGRGEPGYQIPS